MAISIGNIIPDISLDPSKSLNAIINFKYISYLLETILTIVFVYFVAKMFFAPYKIHIYEKIGKNTLRWKGSDYGTIVNTNGVDRMKLFLRKKILPLPLPEFLIVKNKRQNLVNYVKISSDEFHPMQYAGEKVEQLKPIDSNLKMLYANDLKIEKMELDTGKSFLEKNSAIFSFALWGMIGFLIIVMSAKYSANMIDSATKYSNNMIVDANRQASSSAGQIASALTTVQFNTQQQLKQQQESQVKGSNTVTK